MHENFENNEKYFEPTTGIHFSNDGKCTADQKLYTDILCKNVTQNFCIDSNSCGVIMHDDDCKYVSGDLINNCSEGSTPSCSSPNKNTFICTCKKA